jgi:hypothetical protein
MAAPWCARASPGVRWPCLVSFLGFFLSFPCLLWAKLEFDLLLDLFGTFGPLLVHFMYVLQNKGIHQNYGNG